MNGLGAFNMDKVIPLGIEAAAAGTHQILATDLSSFAPSAMIYLYDAETGTVQNLRNNPSYTVNLTAGTHTGRFFIQFTPAVQLTTQNATCAGSDGHLTLSYNSAAVVNVEIKNQVGNVISTIANFNGQQNINNLEAGNYEINFAHSNGAVSVDYFTISGLSTISIQATSSATQATIGESINFTAVVDNGFTSWNFGDGTVLSGNDVNHMYTTAGNYNVTATASNGECSENVVIALSIAATTGIETVSNQSIQWLVNNNQITAKFNNILNDNGSIELFDLAGKLVYSNSLYKGQNQHTIPTAKLSEGIYMVKVVINDQVSTKKVSISK
jgi:PKD repeat protein